MLKSKSVGSGSSLWLKALETTAYHFAMPDLED
jgi:hypothetical protein